MPGVFISYRRSASSHLARLLFEELRQRGLDVFLDVDSVASGELDQILLNEIATRKYFMLVLSRTSLDRCGQPGDWLYREIAEALRLKRIIVPIYDEGFSFDHDSDGLPEPLRSELGRRSGLPYSHMFHRGFIDILCDRFLANAGRVEPQQPDENPWSVKDSPLIRLLPEPFGLSQIPAGAVTIYGGVERLAAFQIARYPITNAQFGLFIRAGGYHEHRYWTAAGWRVREQEGWIEPRYWRELAWNQPDHPVIGLSWYEAVAYCLWLSAVSGLNVLLPTEAQWQRAAQGDDGRPYPWGREWDGNRCNNSVDPCQNDETTPVTAYAGRGDSPFAVSDMVGNVWEWSRTAHKSGSNRVSGADLRVLRGGSWGMLESDFFRVTARDWDAPQVASASRGFRIAVY